jgi:hypothetical protein
VDVPCVMLSDAEIVRALMRYRYDRAFRGERRVPIKTLAEFVGRSHETLFQAVRGKISEDPPVEKLPSRGWRPESDRLSACLCGGRVRGSGRERPDRPVGAPRADPHHPSNP